MIDRVAARYALRTPPRRVAVFRALQLGDLLCAVPALRSLRAGFPAAEITLIGLPWARGFVRRFRAYVDRFVEFAGYPGILEVEVDSERTERFLAEQRAYKYDLAIQMHGSGQTSNPFVLALEACQSAGWYEGVPPPGLTFAAPYPADEPEVLRNLLLARLLGCPDRGTALEFPLLAEDRAEAALHLARLPQNACPLIGLHPGARPPARRWPPDYFAAVADHFARRHSARIILTGGPGEEPLVRAVADRMETRPLDLSGQTSLGGLAALINELDLFISNDTGPAHLANAVDTPSITIFGPADYLRWAPLDRRRHPTVRRPVECSPCGHWECPIDHRCLRWIAPQTVIETAEILLLQVSPR